MRAAWLVAGPGRWPCWRCSSRPTSEATSDCPAWSGSRSPVTTCLWRRPRHSPARRKPLPRLARPGQPRPACAIADSSKLIRPPPRRCRALPGARSGSGTACGSGGPGRRAGRTRAGRRGQGRPERGHQPLRRPAGPVGYPAGRGPASLPRIRRGVRGRPGPRMVCGREALTLTEVKIAALVARGDSTSDVARGMFFSRSFPADGADLYLPHPHQARRDEPGGDRR